MINLCHVCFLFCRRRRRYSGAADVVARVAAVSPIISVRNAPPFFMLEVEQAEHQPQQRQRRHPQQQQRRQQHHQSKQNTLDPFEGDRRASPSSSHSSQLPPPKRKFAEVSKSSKEISRTTEEISRSPEEILALFAAVGAAGSGVADRPSRATADGGGVPTYDQRAAETLVDENVRNAAESSRGGGVKTRLRGVLPGEEKVGRRDALAAGEGEQAPIKGIGVVGVVARSFSESRGGNGKDGKGGSSGGETGTSEREEQIKARKGGGEGTLGLPSVGRRREQSVAGTEGGNSGVPSMSKNGEQLMARLVLTGPRCLAWQSVVVPGKTYLFPSIGAFVLGKGKTFYRAFGDAKQGRGRKRPSNSSSRNGGGGGDGGCGGGGGGGGRDDNIAGKELATPVRFMEGVVTGSLRGGVFDRSYPFRSEKNISRTLIPCTFVPKNVGQPSFDFKNESFHSTQVQEWFPNTAVPIRRYP